MTSEAIHHGGGSQLYPNQGFVKIKAVGENVLSRLRAWFQILSNICLYQELVWLFSIAFMLTQAQAHGEEETGLCKPDPLGPPIPSRANVKVMVVTFFVIIGGIGLAGRMRNRRWPAFTEADINAGLMSEPAVPKRSHPTFEILPSI